MKVWISSWPIVCQTAASPGEDVLSGAWKEDGRFSDIYEVVAFSDSVHTDLWQPSYTSDLR